MKRREFITLLGGAATWPLAARAQQRGVAELGLRRSGSLERIVATARSNREEALCPAPQSLDWSAPYS
jgi:hypothetical protein